MAKEFTVIARLSRDEHKALKKLCKGKKTTLMAFMRELALAALRRAA